jgi:ribosomal protein S1
MNGLISKRNVDAKSFEVTSSMSESYYLPFEECEENRFEIGDVIEFDVYNSDQYGNCVLNPLKLTNIYLDELLLKEGTEDTIVAYVKRKVENGFMVLFNGIYCFLPDHETCIADLRADKLNEILNTYQTFKVLKFRERLTVLSRKEFVKSEIIRLSLEELVNIQIGESFIGRVNQVEGYGLFIANKHFHGLLHITNIVNTIVSPVLPTKLKVFEKLLKAAFKKGDEVVVTVLEKKVNCVNLSWNPNIEPNCLYIKRCKELFETISI